jgi:hypothetical protein
MGELSQPGRPLKFRPARTKRLSSRTNAALHSPMTAPLNGIDTDSAHQLEAQRVAESLEALAQSLAALEPGIERLLVNASADPALLDRARRSARRLRLHVERITLVVDGQNSRPWQGEERRSPQRATNVARLPDRAAGPAKPVTPTPDDWEPF